MLLAALSLALQYVARTCSPIVSGGTSALSHVCIAQVLRVAVSVDIIHPANCCIYTCS